MDSPDSPRLAEAASFWRSGYVHVPFCARVCPYCDFNVVAGKDHLADAYLDRLIREIESEPDWPPLDALYVGGGTPSRFRARRLRRVVAAVEERFGLAGEAEVSLEANPEDWTPDLAEDLAAAGFNRVSFGAQSFDPEVLGSLGRVHHPEQIRTAVSRARRSGFRSVNLDLIYGHPTETFESWKATLESALELEPDHLSAYALTVERGTELSRRVAAGAPAPSPDDQAEKWELADRLLAEAGLVRYEVSNFARVGHHCRYNLSVWNRGEYLGFGAGAHGFRDGIRRWNIRRIDAYIRSEDPRRGFLGLDGWPAEQERVMLGLRLRAGVRPGPVGGALWVSDEGERLREAGVIAMRNGRLVVERPLLTDVAVRAILALEDPGRRGGAGG